DGLAIEQHLGGACTEPSKVLGASTRRIRLRLGGRIANAILAEVTCGLGKVSEHGLDAAVSRLSDGSIGQLDRVVQCAEPVAFADYNDRSGRRVRRRRSGIGYLFFVNADGVAVGDVVAEAGMLEHVFERSTRTQGAIECLRSLARDNTWIEVHLPPRLPGELPEHRG